MRGVSTPYQIKNVPAFDSKQPAWVPSRRRFLFTNFLWFVGLYAIQDSLYKPENVLTVEDEKRFLGLDRENLLWRDPEDGAVTGDEIGYRIFMELLMWAIMIPLAVNLQYSFWSLVAGRGRVWSIRAEELAAPVILGEILASDPPMALQQAGAISYA
ncbi:hypothetical protein AA313_de0203279 [Arthrobotrys entomopaga]|nr:hypothetical protein AA313_de0203279 [Arthrobotrys entomopaga]